MSTGEANPHTPGYREVHRSRGKVCPAPVRAVTWDIHAYPDDPVAPSQPRSIKAFYARLTILTVLVLVTSVGATMQLTTTYARRTEQALVERVSIWLRGTLEEKAREATMSAWSRASSESFLSLLRQPNDSTSRDRVAVERLQVLRSRGFGALSLADQRGHTVFEAGPLQAFAGEGTLPQEFVQTLDRAESLGGFLKVGNDVLLIGGTTVRDGKRTRGYLVLGTPLTAAFLDSLHQAVALPMRLSLSLAKTPSAPLVTGDSFMVAQVLRDVSGAPIATVRATISRTAEQQRLRKSLAILVLVFFGGATLVWAYWYYGRRFLLVPLDVMVRDVEAMRDRKKFSPLTQRMPFKEWEVLRIAFNDTARALVEFQQRYRDVFDRAVDPMFLIDPTTGQVIDANPATISVTGAVASEFIGQRLSEELGAQGPGQRIVRHVRQDGVVTTWGLAANEVSIGGDAMLLAVYRDLTGREALAHAQRLEAIGMLAGGIAHDFNNLLGAVLSGITAARAEVDAGHPVQKVLDVIEHAGERGAQLTRQLLTFSRHDPLLLSQVDIGETLENVRAICARTFDRRIEIDVDVAPELPAVLGDAGEIEQAVLNLCINARDAMPAGGLLRMEARPRTFDADAASHAHIPQAGAYVQILVSDTGVGMSEDVKSKIFHPFFTTKEPGKGTGLGLPTVHGMMRQLGGTILVDSSLTSGTRISLLFPALEERAGSTVVRAAQLVEPPFATPAVPAVSDEGRPCLLLVDDERALREMVCRVLRNAGFSVLESADGRDAVARIRANQHRLCAVLLDMQLRGDLSGTDVLHEVRLFAPHLPVFLCTGYLRDEDIARARRQGVDDILLKPLDIPALIQRLRALPSAHAEAQR